jgi:integrase
LLEPHQYLLMRLKQGLLGLPPAMDVVAFLQHDGKPPPLTHQPRGRACTFAEARDAYLRTRSNGSVEASTLATDKMHLSHLGRTLGDSFPLDGLALADLQRHVDRRAQEGVKAVTIRKEIATLSSLANWAARMGMTRGGATLRSPCKGLAFPKADEPPPYVSWEEAQATGLWDNLYLRPPEVQELLEHVRLRARSAPFVHPMMCFAAYTGARRSEMMRAQAGDVDCAKGFAVIRERKRARGKRTTRRVPLTPFLRQTLEGWLKDEHPGGCSHLFCLPPVVSRSRTRSPSTSRSPVVREALTRNEAHHHLVHALQGSKWERKVRGWHVFRHSFISACACAGIDQRLIDEWVGHSTEEQRRRYRHLFPGTQHAAIASVFD